MWYIQIDTNFPVKMNGIGFSRTQTKNNAKVTKWRYQISYPETLKIFYIFNEYNVIKGTFNVTVQVGTLPEFHLGQLSQSIPSLQSEPNFPIQRGTKCFVTITQNAQNPSINSKLKIAADQQKRIQQLRNSNVVHSFNEKFDRFMTAMSRSVVNIFYIW